MRALPAVLLLLASLLPLPARAQVPTGLADYREVDETWAAEGVVEAVNQSTVSAQVAGRVVDIRFDVGDRVEKGQVILRIDEREAAQQQAGREAQAAEARALLANARQSLERTRALRAKGFVSQSALDRAESEYKAAEAAAAAGAAGAGQAATVRGFTTIVAPYSGVVAARHVELGEMAVPGKPLMTGFDPATLRLVASLPQAQVEAVRRGGAAAVEFPALGLTVKATTLTILPQADAKSLATRVRLDLPADLKGVFPGVFGRAHFTVGRSRKLTVPASAVLRRGEVTAVYVIDAAGRAQLRQVRPGTAAGVEWIEILAGLAPGEKVALDPLKASIEARAPRP